MNATPLGLPGAQPLVTVIIPFRNAGRWLEACCASLRGQTLQAWRALLIDDGSEDNSLELAWHQAQADHRFEVLRCCRKAGDAPGPWLPRNLGLQQASSAWLAFLDADDLWHPRKLETQLQALQRRQADLCVCAYYRFVGRSGRIVELRTPPAAITAAGVRNVNPLPMSSVVIRRTCLEGLAFRGVSHEDHDLWQRLLASRAVGYVRLPEALMAYRLHSSNLTQGLANRLAMKRRSLSSSQQGIWQGLAKTAWQQLGYGLQALPWRWHRQRLESRGFLSTGVL
jgi:teichuronic acid biosynthesis glycosyltransferase TuaG